MVLVQPRGRVQEPVHRDGSCRLGCQQLLVTPRVGSEAIGPQPLRLSGRRRLLHLLSLRRRLVE